ncbi:MAG: DNA double-strand break repair nuclease NurA [bacterium]
MMLLKKISKYIKDKKNNGANITVPKSQGEDENFIQNLPLKTFVEKPAEVIEEKDKKLRIKQVKYESDQSGFVYFLDGIERKTVLFNYDFIPVIYGYVAAVIMKRTDKQMHFAGLEDKKENIYLPYKENGDEPEHYFNLHDFAEYDLIPVNTGKKDRETKEYPLFSEEFNNKARGEIQKFRTNIEQDLAKKWLNQKYDDGWLFVDGRLSTKSRNLLSDPRVVGVTKSHHAYYFAPEDQFKIYNLKKGERSSVFRLEKKYEEYEKEDVYSWYLRLYNNNYNGNNTFGIIRVEIPADEELVKQADKISGWILLETKPVAFPASRWDRMIYPIKYCEDYLRAKAPSWALIESML